MSITHNLDSRPGASEAEKAPEPKAATLWQISKNVVARISKDNLTLVAAGVAFYAMTAIFPAIAAFVSIYGLFADPNAVQQQISGFAGLLPANSLKLITDALQSFASKSTSSLNVALLVSVGLAIRSAKAGILALISGLNIANETEEKRGFIMQQVIALILTVGAVLFAMVALAAVALLPIVIDIFPLPDALKATLGLGRWPMLVVMVVMVVMVGFGLAVVYRFGPSREHQNGVGLLGARRLRPSCGSLVRPRFLFTPRASVLMMRHMALSPHRLFCVCGSGSALLPFSLGPKSMQNWSMLMPAPLVPFRSRRRRRRFITAPDPHENGRSDSAVYPGRRATMHF